MFTLEVITVVLGIMSVVEGRVLYVIFKEYRKQLLKVELLSGIIEERFSKHGKDFDNG